MAEEYALGEQTVDFSVLVRKAAEDSYSTLKELTGIAPEQSDSQRKLGLLKYILRTRQRMLRLLVLSKWCCQIPLVERCQQLAGTLSNHDTSFTQGADFLFFLHDGIQQARAPIYDIPTAAEVLLSGHYSKLPKCIEDLGMSLLLIGEERETTMCKLDTLLRSRLLNICLPKALSAIKISDGRIVVTVNGEFEVQLTLGYRGNLSLWRVLHLQILAGDSTGPFVFTEHQRLAVVDDLERRMAAVDDPFEILHSILHEFCTTLVMDTLFRQAGLLCQGRWKDAIRFEKVSEISSANPGENVVQSATHAPGLPGDMDSETKYGMKARSSLGLKIWYWVDCPKGLAGVDLCPPPHLRIEHGPSHNLVCSHHPPVTDPATENEAEFAVDMSCVDVEKLVLKAIACNIHSRLLEVRRGLRSSSLLWRVDCDVVLRCSFPQDEDYNGNPASKEIKSSGTLEEAGEEVLCVRAYSSAFIALGISIRNGQFILHSPNTLLANSILMEMEDALNQGSVVPANVFLNLRSKSLLHVLASIGTSFNLKIYERGASALKLPSDAQNLVSDVLVMGFPNCGEVYFLSAYIDSNFMPRFRLLEVQAGPSPQQASCLSGPMNILRSMMIKIDTILVSEDDSSFGLLDEGQHEVAKHGTPGIKFSRFVTKDMRESLSSKEEDPRILGRVLANIRGLDGSQAECSDKHQAGHLFKSKCHISPSLSPHPSPSGLQGGALSNQQYGGSSKLFEGSNGGYSQGNAAPASTYIQPTSRVVRIGPGNGIGAGPVSGPFHKGLMNLKSSIHGDQDLLQSKSPLHVGESASSPINLDDDDISKLIDSIASKNGSVVPGGCQTFPGGDCCSPCSRQPLLVMGRSGPVTKSPVMNPRLPQAKALPGPATGQSATSLARLGSPRKTITSLTASESDLIEHDQYPQPLHSLTHLLSPSVRLSAVGTQFMVCSMSSTGILLQDSKKRKQCGTHILSSLPSVQEVVVSSEMLKRRKMDLSSCPTLGGNSASDLASVKALSLWKSFRGQPFAAIVAAANQGRAPMGSYTTVLLHVVKMCWLCIKHARLTSQMDALNIHFVEEVGLFKPSFNLWFRLPLAEPCKDYRKPDSTGWHQICLNLGKLGSDGWEVVVQDAHFRGLWELYKRNHSSSWGQNVQFASVREEDSHICCSQKGLVLSYSTVQDDSIKNMMTDLERLWNVRMFAVTIRTLLEEIDEDMDRANEKVGSEQGRSFASDAVRFCERDESREKKWEVMRRTFRVEAVGPTTMSFTYIGLIPGVMARFLVEWEVGHTGCTVHVSPEQLWPHTKYLEDFINGGEVELLLNCIQVTVGPLSSLASAIRPARILGPVPSTTASVTTPGQSAGTASKPVATLVIAGQVPATVSSTASSTVLQSRVPNGPTSVVSTTIQASQPGVLASGTGRPGSGLVPSSLLPSDVSVLLRTPYWIRIVYRKQFAMDMRCFGGDQVWLQPAPPPRSGGPGLGGSLPCPQFRPFVMEHVTLGLNCAESLGGSALGNQSVSGSFQTGFSSGTVGWGQILSPGMGTARSNPGALGVARLGSNAIVIPNRVSQYLGSQNVAGNSGIATNPGRSLVAASNIGIRGEYSALFGLGDDGGYGGAWVPLAALKKVLRGTLRYLGVLWLFAQFPNILRDVLGSILRENEGSLLNHDPEQPALRFFIGNCVFAVSMHRQQLYLQAINVKKFQQQQGQQSQASGPELELSSTEMQEIGDFFNRRVASEPYDASRVASFITMLTLPVPVLRDFLKLIAWKKEQHKAAVALGQNGDSVPTSRPKVELCLENRLGSGFFPATDEDRMEGSSVVKSSIQHHRSQNIVEFTLTIHLETVHLPSINVAGGAGWLPQCIAVRLRYQFCEPYRMLVVNVEGSHGGQACWHRPEDWERCKAGIVRAVDHHSASSGEPGHGRLKSVAEFLQGILHNSVLQLRRGFQNAASPIPFTF